MSGDRAASAGAGRASFWLNDWTFWPCWLALTYVLAALQLFAATRTPEPGAALPRQAWLVLPDPARPRAEPIAVSAADLERFRQRFPAARFALPAGARGRAEANGRAYLQIDYRVADDGAITVDARLDAPDSPGSGTRWLLRYRPTPAGPAAELWHADNPVQRWLLAGVAAMLLLFGGPGLYFWWAFERPLRRGAFLWQPPFPRAWLDSLGVLLRFEPAPDAAQLEGALGALAAQGAKLRPPRQDGFACIFGRGAHFRGELLRERRQPVALVGVLRARRAPWPSLLMSGLPVLAAGMVLHLLLLGLADPLASHPPDWTAVAFWTLAGLAAHALGRAWRDRQDAPAACDVLGGRLIEAFAAQGIRLVPPRGRPRLRAATAGKWAAGMFALGLAAAIVVPLLAGEAKNRWHLKVFQSMSRIDAMLRVLDDHWRAHGAFPASLAQLEPARRAAFTADPERFSALRIHADGSLELRFAGAAEGGHWLLPLVRRGWGHAWDYCSGGDLPADLRPLPCRNPQAADGVFLPAPLLRALLQHALLPAEGRPAFTPPAGVAIDPVSPAAALIGQREILPGGGVAVTYADHPSLPAAMRGRRVVLTPFHDALNHEWSRGGGPLRFACDGDLPEAHRPSWCQRGFGPPRP